MINDDIRPIFDKRPILIEAGVGNIRVDGGTHTKQDFVRSPNGKAAHCESGVDPKQFKSVSFKDNVPYADSSSAWTANLTQLTKQGGITHGSYQTR